jgi:hypothetical protein
MFMLTVQALPYLATVVTAILSAVSNSERSAVIITPAPPPAPETQLKEAA